MKTKLLSLILLLSLNNFCSYSQNKPKITSGTLGMMEARQIGPAVMGGRISAIDAVAKDPRIVFVGTAGGGIWKSTTGGTLFKPIFEKNSQSIGAIAVDQNNPDVVWCGTGESNMRNSVSIGTGLYKSTDGGDNWVKMGFDSSEHISRIAINPKNSNEVYVAVPGHLWNDNIDRGLYKTTDGGKTWEKILYVDEKTGCAEVLINPKNPEIIYASTWEFRRKPYAFSSGGKGSAVYKSTDSGKTWKKLSKGLPAGEFGRVAMALAPSEPDNLFAIVEAKKTSLFLSTDGGENWTEQGSNNNVEGRPFYFSVIAVDPVNPKRVYRPAWSLSISDDGGRSFSDASMAGGWIHSDHHALWINPNNPSHLLLGTDGGIYISLDKGNNWLFLNNIPVSQFYHVSLDDETPYHVYGGLQDNGSWMAASQSIGGISNGDWINVGGGDGFWVQPDKTDKNIVYSESQGGYASRANRKTNEYQDIQPKPLTGEPKLRFNWNTPLCVSPTNPKTLYMGAQYLYRSYNKGITWDRISPDLTTNDSLKQKQEESGGVTTDNSSAENHCTIFTVAESPLDEKIIFVGTDDGNLQLTVDGGKKWTKLNQDIKDIPAQTWVSSIEPSRYDKNTVYATFDNHMYGDMKTYCCKSTDMGKTWKLLNTIPLNAGYAHKIREDILNRDLLFLGTELGLYVSFDGGDNFTQMNAKIPPVAVRDIQVDPKSNDLVLATHGRGVLIVDDISPLRQLTPEVIESEAAILKTRPVPLTGGHYGGAFPSAGGFVGPNSDEQARIIYYLKDRVTTGDLKVEIFDRNGKLAGTVPATKRKGINIISWSMRSKPPKVARGVRIDGAGFFGQLVETGTYTVKLTKGDKVFTGTIQLVDDPVSQHSAEDKALQRSTSARLFKMSEDLAYFNQQVLNMKDSVQKKSDATKDDGLKKTLDAFSGKLEKIRKELIATKGGQSITGEERIREKLSELYGSVVGYEGRPSDSQLERVKGLQHEIDEQQKIAEELWKKDLPGVNKELNKANLGELLLLTREDFNKSDHAGAQGSSNKFNFHAGYRWMQEVRMENDMQGKE
ncbi:MAG: glycosyl hydrolase [Bacteroidetes bacterium]|nr:glycosyl hydrolase [Bacteroidota bacterium]